MRYASKELLRKESGNIERQLSYSQLMEAKNRLISCQSVVEQYTVKEGLFIPSSLNTRISKSKSQNLHPLYGFDRNMQHIKRAKQRLDQSL